MRTVLDTNVLISGLLTPGGVCRRILDLAFRRVVRLCVDERILQEYETVLPRPLFEFDPEDLAATLELMRTAADFVASEPLGVDLPHASDRPFLEVAHDANAILVTGNLRDFPKHARAGVTVLSPREFLDLLARSS